MKSEGNLSITKTLSVAGRVIDLREPKTMGVINVTPDSFYAGSRQVAEADILKKAEQMLSEGATFLDVGGYSSRPGAKDVPEEEELKRIIQAIKPLMREFPDALISIDTFRSAVASAAVQEGASIVNDISGGELDPGMIETVGRLRVPYILMHMRGNPSTMKDLNAYDDLIGEITDFFHTRIHTLQQAGVHDVIIDPGFGFAKNIDQNFELLSRLDVFRITGKPLLAGLSRKSMIWKSLDVQPQEALNGSTVLNTIALLKGASILRVHDVKEAMEAIRLTGRLHQ